MLLIRDRNDVLRVFHNVCSHRGTQLVDASGPCGRVIRCPYHSWGYALDGQLLSTPKIGGANEDSHADFDPRAHGLRQVRAAILFGTVFVDLSGKAPEFSDFSAPLRARWRNFADRDLIHVSDGFSAFSLELSANWKLAVDNYCESCHLPWVHPSLNSYSRLEDHYHIQDPAKRFSGQGTTVYRPTLSADGRGFPCPADLAERWATQAEYIALFPNVLLGVHKDHAFAILLLPQGPARTLERVAFFYYDEAVKAEKFAALRRANGDLWRTVFVEDVDVVERMQIGRRSPGFEGGVFSPAMDGPSHDFHRWMAARLSETTTA